MIVEESRGRSGDYDNFPVGMRVLAVDDDPICLKLLDGLLRKCQYHVTTTSQARMALKMLRENRDRFDLVISDVHMPDMDGFKLLELVGLEMDLPVIMLSANSDTRLVMKGITHGACDYLVKPVRIEELRNIWQHVLRRKKFDPNHPKRSPEQDSAQQGNVEGGQGPSLTGNGDHNGKVSKKRKDEDDEAEDSEHENDDPATQKKPRVVWSIDLHRKFVTAVNQLGIEKAVPKRILDLMNVEGLTRENVASHLQKYRLYLKRISTVATQQANMVAAYGSKDAYMRMGSLDGLGNFQPLAGSGRLANTVLPPYNPSGMLGRLNSPTGVSLRNFTSSGMIQPSLAQNLNNTVNNIGQLPPVISPGSHNGNLIQGTPSFELDQLHQSKCTSRLGDFNPPDDSRVFSPAGTYTDPRALGNASSSLSCAANSSLMLQENCSPIDGGGFGNQSSLPRSTFHSDSLNVGVSSSSDFLDMGRSNENWKSPSQLPKFQSNSLHLVDPLTQGHLPLRDNNSTAVPSLLNPHDISATNTRSTPVENTRRGLTCEGNFAGAGVPNLSQLQSERWGDHKQNYSQNSDSILSTLNPQFPTNTRSQNIDQNCVLLNRKFGMPLAGLTNGGASALLQQGEIDKFSSDPRMRSNDDYLSGQTKPQGSFVPQSYDSLDDLMNAMIKREQDGTRLDGEFGFDAYPFGSCM